MWLGGWRHGRKKGRTDGRTDEWMGDGGWTDASQADGQTGGILAWLDKPERVKVTKVTLDFGKSLKIHDL